MLIMKKLVRTVNVVNCEGAACVCLSKGREKYYAENISGRDLKFKRYIYVERIEK